MALITTIFQNQTFIDKFYMHYFLIDLKIILLRCEYLSHIYYSYGKEN
jgi:hypothetical protein